MKKTNQFKTFLIAAFVAVSFGAFAQVKIGTDPTTIEPASNLEVEASTGQRKVKVDKTSGQLTIKDGTEGDGKILTSDANGGASWKINVPTQVKLKLAGAQGITINNVNNTINYSVEDFDTGNNSVGNSVVISESGLYDIGANVNWGTANIAAGNPGAWSLRLFKNGIYIEQFAGARITPNISETAMGRILVRLVPGDVIRIVFLTGQSSGQCTLDSSVLTVLKVAN